MSIKQISVFLENSPGTLQSLCETLAEANIDMRALSLAEAGDFGIARIIVNRLYDATHALKDAGFVCSVTPVVAAAIPDTPGGLGKVLSTLSSTGNHIDYMYAFLGGPEADHAYMIFKTADAAKAAAALSAKGISILDQEDVESL